MTKWWRANTKPHFRMFRKLEPISGWLYGMGWLSLVGAIYRAPTVLIKPPETSQMWGWQWWRCLRPSWHRPHIPRRYRALKKSKNCKIVKLYNWNFFKFITIYTSHWSPGVRRSMRPNATGAMAMLHMRNMESATHKEASNMLNTLCISLKFENGTNTTWSKN